ncbi:B-cell linker protein isoform X2 [Mugil cephalus]|uniref:B-cell linker protein isoform X2 n=1 Tax=Mugil cephalus TaxID=48193 RepID=UPI001FB61473|nr:B-cell linker protein isoform X2 [Mugil cephalus]
MNLPSREECEGWDHAQVAFFMCKNKMQECVTTVNRLKINGQRLLNLSDSDMSKFSLMQQPQLQKIVQDIKKNDGGILNKLRRLKSKPIPSVPARDYRDDNKEGDDQLSDFDYDPHEDDNYEPPPSHRSFTATPSASLPRGEYLDSCRNRPSRPPRKPLHPGKGSKQLPPEPAQVESDDEDYINPDEDNYIEPAENPPANLMLHGGNRNRRDQPTSSPQSPGFYEVPNQETSLSLPANRACPVPTTQSHSLPLKPSPRVNARRSPPPEPADDDEYEVCDPDDSHCKKTAEGPPLPLPRPLPKERSPKPPLRPRPDLKPREFESRTLPVVHNDQKLSPKAFTMDMKRPKIPLPQFTPLKPPERSVSAENGSTDQDKDADVYNKPWYASSCDRKAADDALISFNKDGAFMVRKSSGHDSQQPYTLVVFYRGRVYNIPIRFVPNTQQYALGREKKGEEYFRTVCHIIENHQRNPLVLIDSQSNSKDATKLCYPVKP